MARQRGEKEQKKIICVRANQKELMLIHFYRQQKVLYVFCEISVTQSANGNYAGCRKNKNRNGEGRPVRCRSNAPLLPLDLLYIRFLRRGVTLKSLVIED